MGKDNTRKIPNYDIEYYENRIHELMDDYIDTLINPDDIQNRITFTGSLRYIYKHLFKPGKNDIVYNNRNSIIDYSDIYLLMDIYNCYIDLCARYKKECSINGFSTLTGITIETLNQWEKGNNIPNYSNYNMHYNPVDNNTVNNIYNNINVNNNSIDSIDNISVNDNDDVIRDNKRVLPKRLWSEFVKNIKRNSEQALSESMLSGNLMAYAQLKCWYGWKEEPQQVQVLSGSITQSALEIAEKHKGATLPEIPEDL